MDMKYKEGSSVVEHLNRFQDTVDQLAAMKMILDNKLQTLLLLNSLPNN